ncbi:MAG: quinol:cytochrome C oxidoreductase [Phycisphaerae bacterium]|nr:quinol:cytochrome C oxidoreductase [Phycisphaerae bacterium]
MSHGHSAAIEPSLEAPNIRLAPAGLKTRRLALAAGVVGIGATVLLGGSHGGEHGVFLAKSWLQVFLLLLAVSLGSLFFVIIQHLTRAGWSVTVRRPAELLASNLTWIWVLFLPFVAMAATGRLGVLFPWADLEHLRAHNPGEYDLVVKKIAFLNQPFFWARASVYFLVWALLARFFLKGSLEVGDTGSQKAEDRMAKWSGPAAILFGLTTTFASFDWIMSLSPGWFSTMFGVYFFAASVTAGFSALILCCVLLQRAGRLQGLVTAEHYQDLGKLLFGFGIVFWAYIGFSQYMLIWYANIPEETGWFLVRQIGGWAVLSFALLFGHFVIPFVGLISRWPKRFPSILALGAVWMLVFAWIDFFWLVMPVIPADLATATDYRAFVDAHASAPTGLLNPINLTMTLGLCGIYVWATLNRLERHPLLCRRDPWLQNSIAFENM